VRNVAAYVSRGALAVEMEVSAIYAVGLFHGISVTAAVVICDTLAGGKWHLGVDAPEFTAALKATSSAAFDFGLVRSGLWGADGRPCRQEMGSSGAAPRSRGKRR
jgi:hypothetical protein